MEKFECRECKVKYSRAVGGQGFTKFTCEKCGQTAWYHNTLTPHYCPSCCEENYICQRCGKDLLKEAILAHAEKYGMYDAALEIGVSDVSLRTFVNKGRAGYKVRNKIIKWYEGFNEG